MTIRCVIHVSGLDERPCAWPDCAYGVATSEYLQNTREGTILLQRVRLDSYSGEERYFWLVEGERWLSIERDVRICEVALAQRDDHSGDRVYHYTSLSAFKDIIESRELWLSDYAYLNDSSEIAHGLSVAKEVLDLLLPSLSDDCGNLFKSFLTLPPEDQPRICVACFSFERDSLTQWKGYGAHALGICFGIDVIAFATSTGNKHTARYTSVVYRDDTKRHLLRTFFHDWNVLLELDRTASAVDIERYEKVARMYFFELLATIKHESFKDEREFRMIYQEHAKLFTAMGLDLVPKRFRIAGPLIVPFTTTSDLASLRLARDARGQNPRIEITDVVVGPHALKDLAVSGIREFLLAKGYDVDVEPSRVPFR